MHGKYSHHWFIWHCRVTLAKDSILFFISSIANILIMCDFSGCMEFRKTQMEMLQKRKESTKSQFDIVRYVIFHGSTTRVYISQTNCFFFSPFSLSMAAPKDNSVNSSEYSYDGMALEPCRLIHSAFFPSSLWNLLPFVEQTRQNHLDHGACSSFIFILPFC